ncbi:MAG: DUF5331 domain-containing protein [Cuspidothrix sp.]
MDIQRLRQSLKIKWLNYYEQNRAWLVKMRIWKDYDGIRRPSSGYILATLSVLEPELKKILPFILDLNNNPDQIITALCLQFNPEQELNLLKSQHSLAKNEILTTSPIHIPLTDSSQSKQRQQVLLKTNTSVAVVAVSTSNAYPVLNKLPIEVNREQMARGRYLTQRPSNIPPVPSSHSHIVPSWIDELCPGRSNGIN